MSKRIEALKYTVLQLERALAQNDFSGIKNASNMIKELTSEIENDSKMINQKETGVYFKKINTIPFIYKPMHVDNPYDGDYLVQFSRERTEQLMRSGAINEHNKFWTDHEVIRGNVFGSVPKELISEDAFFALKRMGWQEVKVDVLDFGKRVTDINQLYDFCDANFDKFIFISETTTNAKLALKFAV